MEVRKERPPTTVVIVGAGKGGTALLEILFRDPSTHILGVVDKNPDAPGMKLARERGIPTAKRAESFLLNPDRHVDILIDVTGNEEVRRHLQEVKKPTTRMIGGAAAKFVWALIEAYRTNEVLQEEVASLKATLSDAPGEELIFGHNPAMQQVRDMVLQVAPTPATVLITGETGTGKELIARTIQRLSPLRDKPFVKINCTAFSPQLLESELFGYKKGAFTGALKDKPGLLEKGHGGTIFLDEIGDITPEMQVKMLRFLQFGEIRPVGGTETRTVQARIIAATNRNLEQMIGEEKFRADLYYRLNTFTIHLPPLRERKEDLPLLAYHFLKQAEIRLNKKVGSISKAAMSCLMQYDYPGNLRELQSIIERAVILCKGNQIEPEHLPHNLQPRDESWKLEQGLVQARRRVLARFELQAIQYYLREAGGNVSKAAMLARMPRRSFYRLMDKYGIKKSDYEK